MQSVDGFRSMLQQYIGQNIAYLFVVLALFIFLSRQKKQIRLTAVIAILLLFVAIFNPISYKLLVNFSGQEKTYYRFFWLIPCEAAMAYFVYESIQCIENLKYKLILVCGICIGLLLLNTSQEEWQLPENSYQLPYDILEVAWELDELRTEKNKEKITVLADTNISHVIREYDATICFPFTNYHVGKPKSLKGDVAAIMNMLEDNRDDLDAATVEETLSANNVDYLVINRNNAISLSYMQELHWQIIATTSAYHILQYQNPTNVMGFSLFISQNNPSSPIPKSAPRSVRHSSPAPLSPLVSSAPAWGLPPGKAAPTRLPIPSDPSPHSRLFPSKPYSLH